MLLLYNHSVPFTYLRKNSPENPITYRSLSLVLCRVFSFKIVTVFCTLKNIFLGYLAGNFEGFVCCLVKVYSVSLVKS